MSRIRRSLALLALGAATLIALAAPASAHVTVNPKEATKGGFTKLSFRVPNERDDASTTKLAVQLPDDRPIANVSVKPVAGWTATVERKLLPAPVTDDDGNTVTEAPSVITWTAASGAEIKPGEFQEFDVSVGPLPEDTDELVFPSVQTYSSGEVVRWTDLEQPGGEEPEHPAPVLKLVDPVEGEDHHGNATDATDAAASSESHDDSDSDGGKGIAIVALIVGALGLGAGVAGIAIGRR